MLITSVESDIVENVWKYRVVSLEKSLMCT